MRAPTHLYMKFWMRGPVRGRSRRLAARRMVVLKLCSWSRSFCCWGSRGGAPWGAWAWAWGFPGGFLGTTACTPHQTSGIVCAQASFSSQLPGALSHVGACAAHALWARKICHLTVRAYHRCQ